MKKIAVIIAIALMFIAPDICQAKSILFKSGTGSVTYTCQKAPFKGRIIEIYYHIPEGDISKMPVQFVMHGDNRNGDGYRDAWVKVSDKYGFVTICPNFAKNIFDDEEYHRGNLRAADGSQNPKEMYVYNLIDEIFDYFLAHSKSKAKQFNIYGHSAGGQFVHRMLTFRGGNRIGVAISANAGWYTMPTEEINFPYGVGDPSGKTDGYKFDKKAFYAAPLTILLGTADTLRSANLNQSAKADKQGKTRWARGNNYYQWCKADAEKLGYEFNWKIDYVQGVGHSNKKMGPAAAAIIYGKPEPLTAGQEKEIEGKLLSYMDECKTVGMSVVLVKGNNIVYQKALGYQNLETKEPLEINDIFRIASISKSFSAASILQLQEQGKINLDDDVNKYLPFSLRNPRFPDIPITVKQLLSHNSSMRDFAGASWYRDDRFVNPSKTSQDTIAKMFFNYAPGWGFKYCNRALNLMGMVIESASGERFDNYVRQHILLPMGIEEAGFNLDSLDNSKFVKLYKYDKKKDQLELGAGYVPVNEKKIANGTYKPVADGCYWSPTGGMKISAPDLAKWMMTLRDNGFAPNGARILSEESAIKMKSPVTPPDAAKKWQYYCLNLFWQPYLIEGRTMIGHTGSAQGLKSCMFFDKDSNWGIVCICSSENGETGIDAEGKDTGVVKVYYETANYLFNRFKDILLAE